MFYSLDLLWQYRQFFGKIKPVIDSLAHTPDSDLAEAVYGGGPRAVRFQNVAMRYGRGPEILQGINLSLPHGSMNFLTGASGAGKSSLLKLIYLQNRPSRGLISLFGQDTALLEDRAIPAMRRRIGLVLQDFGLIDHVNLFDNVALPLRVSGHKRSNYEEDIRDLLRWVGLGHRLTALPPTLSGGEKQRACIARAVIAKPDILLADEPTANVDPEMGERLIRLFSEMNRMGTTLLIATHNVSLIPQNSPHYHLDKGHLRRVDGTDFNAATDQKSTEISVDREGP